MGMDKINLSIPQLKVQSWVEGYYCPQKKVIFLNCVSVYDTNQLNSLFGEVEENLSEKVNIVILNLFCFNANF